MGANIQNFPFSGNHGATPGRHWVHYEPSVLRTLEVGTYVLTSSINHIVKVRPFVTAKTFPA